MGKFWKSQAYRKLFLIFFEGLKVEDCLFAVFAGQASFPFTSQARVEELRPFIIKSVESFPVFARQFVYFVVFHYLHSKGSNSASQAYWKVFLFFLALFFSRFGRKIGMEAGTGISWSFVSRWLSSTCAARGAAMPQVIEYQALTE